jgi:hypothetical protein
MPVARRPHHASMHSGRDNTWRGHLVEASGAVADGTSAKLYRSVAAGSLIRIAPGLFLPRDIWQSLDPDDRFRVRIDAAVLRFPGDGPLSHLSAAAMWDCRIWRRGRLVSRCCAPATPVAVRAGAFCGTQSGCRATAR